MNPSGTREHRRLFRHTLAPLCEVAAIGIVLLILPAALVDWIFGTSILALLAQFSLLIVAAAAILAALGTDNDWFTAPEMEPATDQTNQPGPNG
jgi:uncharacterized membrane protein